MTVNATKRQYLDPHKFGAGLKLMEFSGQAYSIGQALLILLAHSNGRGGGDLRCNDHDPENLVGSWAGDQIVVAGDYDDPWLFVPEDLKGKEYLSEEYPQYGGLPVKVTQKFGFKKKKFSDDAVEPRGETLYSAARHFFEDISDKIIAVVAKGDAPYHPWAAMDLNDDGWRDYPEFGVLPKKTPEKPAGGEEVWNKYQTHAVAPMQDALDIMIHHLRGSIPEKRAELLSMLQEASSK